MYRIKKLLSTSSPTLSFCGREHVIWKYDGQQNELRDENLTEPGQSSVCMWHYSGLMIDWVDSVTVFWTNIKTYMGPMPATQGKYGFAKDLHHDQNPNGGFSL